MIRRDEDIRLMPEGREFYKKVTDPELKILSKLLCERLFSAREAKDKASMLQVLKDLMQDEVVHFHYEKVSGEMRTAFGTRLPEIISRHGGDPNGEGREGPLKTFAYFDIVRRAWRSFRPESIVDIDQDYVI